MARHHVQLCLLTLLYLAPQGCCTNVEANLIQSLLKNYDVSARPIVNKSAPINVRVSLELQHIANLDERQQELKIKVWQRHYWTDEFLTWNASEHGGIKSLKISPNRIWHPDITLYDDMSEESLDDDAHIFRSIVYQDGTIQSSIPKILTSRCNVDVSNYPWDEQTCTLKFGSWSYDQAEMDIFTTSQLVDLTYYTTSTEWSILSFEAEKNVVQYNCCPNAYPDVTYTLRIRRKVQYFWANILIPALLITMTGLLVFYLPPESGEKVSLCVTVQLALIVFLLVVAESVPKSDSVPILTKYFGATGLLLALSTMATMVTLRIHYRGVFGNRVPGWAKEVVLNWLARALCMNEKVDGSLASPISTKRSSVKPEPIEHVSGDIRLVGVKAIQTNNILAKDGKSLGNNKAGSTMKMEVGDGKKHEDYQEVCNREWILVAAVFDRFLLVLFTLATIGTAVGILSNHSHSDLEPIA